MISKIEERHRQKPAYIYIRQSTMGQVRHHQESTQRQYALREKALELGWTPTTIRVLDGDLGLSGTQASQRRDFKTLVADVSMGQIGAVFALEASRLARSCLDWQRLLELCALTGTLVIDEDGCYDPAEFNDGLLLGLKGTIAQAELHFIRVRLLGGKRNKALRGELRCPLPVGFTYDDQGHVVLDPDEEVQGAVRLVFTLFRRTGSAYAVIQEFRHQGLRFPKRAYGGAWNGNLIWGQLSHARVLGILKNPTYAGVYAFGRYRTIKGISPEGEVCQKTRLMPQNEWLTNLPEHHEGYISWEEFQKNDKRLELNRTNLPETLSCGPAREGLALLQGLLICAVCGHKLTVRYKSNGGIAPTYECNWRKREGVAASGCLSLRAESLDAAIAKQVIAAVVPSEISVALEAMEELTRRDKALCRQWQMRLERAEYEAQLAERRYLEVDPANRLVANSLERRWNEALLALEDGKLAYAEFRRNELRVVTAEQKSRLLRLSEDFSRLWQAPTTTSKDKKRLLRLLIKDITVEKCSERKQAVMHLRWQGGACETLQVDLPRTSAEVRRYPEDLVAKVRNLVQDDITDAQIAEVFNREGRLSSTGKPFTEAMIRWIRFKHSICPRTTDKMTVKNLAEKFGISTNVVYYWLKQGLIVGQRKNSGSPYLFTLDAQRENSLRERVQRSTKMRPLRNSTAGGAV
jgi:DNA invertase Pin-like site-specific DNA recombinase